MTWFLPLSLSLSSSCPCFCLCLCPLSCPYPCPCPRGVLTPRGNTMNDLRQMQPLKRLLQSQRQLSISSSTATGLSPSTAALSSSIVAAGGTSSTTANNRFDTGREREGGGEEGEGGVLDTTAVVALAAAHATAIAALLGQGSVYIRSAHAVKMLRSGSNGYNGNNGSTSGDRSNAWQMLTAGNTTHTSPTLTTYLLTYLYGSHPPSASLSLTPPLLPPSPPHLLLLSPLLSHLHSHANV